MAWTASASADDNIVVVLLEWSTSHIPQRTTLRLSTSLRAINAALLLPGIDVGSAIGMPNGQAQLHRPLRDVADDTGTAIILCSAHGQFMRTYTIFLHIVALDVYSAMLVRRGTMIAEITACACNALMVEHCVVVHNEALCWPWQTLGALGIRKGAVVQVYT